jgi:predicted lipoprotein with Yx(FWY)xxD motif
MYMKRGAILIACGLLLVMLTTACSSTTNTNAMGVATATSTTRQQTNGTTQINGQDQRANGQSTVQVTPAPTKSGNESNQDDSVNNQNSTTQVTPTPVVSNNTQNGHNDQSSSQKSNTQDTSTTTINNGNSQAATPTTTSGGTMYITTRVVTVNGAGMNVLTTGTGMTLYYRMSDPAPASSCTGNCAATWPPLLNHNMTIIPGQNFSGQLTVQQTANGPQVEYNGRPLYTYVGDSAAGQANGNGLGGVWYPVQIQPAKSHW